MHKLLLLLIFPFLIGCLNPSQRFDPIVVKDPDVKTATKDDLTSSTNLMQSQIQGIGATIGQLANKMSLIDGDLLKIQNSLNIMATATAIADIKTDIRSSIHAILDVKTRLDAKIEAVAQIETKLSAMADVSAKLDAQATMLAQLESKIQGQAGLFNKMDELRNDVKSGRDSVVTTIQFTDNVMKTIIYGNLFYAGVIIVIVVAISIVLLVLTSNSRKRAEERYRMERDHRVTLQRGGE